MGEAGLEEWEKSIAERPVNWRVVASSEALQGGSSVFSQSLFEHGIPRNVNFHGDPLAHLDVAVRSHRAQRWFEWVNYLLNLDVEAALGNLPEASEFPCYVTRDLENARSWLRMHRHVDPEERTGLLASSSDSRLRAYGIEMSQGFRRGFAFERWFLDSADDVRSSNLLEVAASEFECQGLELDWVGMCWGGDLTPANDLLSWKFRKFKGTQWQKVRQDTEKAYSLNRYRVLLTRARKGIVIWVPPGDLNYVTQDPRRFDRVYEVLRNAGVPVLEEHFDRGSLEVESN